MRGELAVETKPPGPSCDDGPGGVGFAKFENLAIDQAMTFLRESKLRASDVITSALPFWVEPLPFWLKARSTIPAVLDETPWADEAGLYITVSALAWVTPLIKTVGVLLPTRPALELFFEPLTPFDPLEFSVPMDVSPPVVVPPVVVCGLSERSECDAPWATNNTPSAST